MTKKTTKPETERKSVSEIWTPLSKLDLQRAADQARAEKGLPPVLCQSCAGAGRALKELPPLDVEEREPGQGPERGIEEKVCQACNGTGRAET